VTTRGAFHRQGPFVGSGGPYSPGPATATPPFGCVRRPLNDALTPSWVLAGPSPYRMKADRQTSLRPTPPRCRATLARWIHRDCAGLGPRSLVPPPFLERCVRAYSRPRCCLPTSATAYDVRATKPELSSPRRDGGRDHLPFLTNHALSLSRAVIRGEPHIVRTIRSRCRFLLLA